MVSTHPKQRFNQPHLIRTVQLIVGFYVLVRIMGVAFEYTPVLTQFRDGNLVVVVGNGSVKEVNDFLQDVVSVSDI